MVRGVEFETLRSQWRAVCTFTFSDRLSLYDFQLTALKNAAKCLYLYFYVDKADNHLFYKRYRDLGLTSLIENQLNLQMDNYPVNTSKILQEYYSSEDGKVEFKRFLQRAAFWMATGSGKTLVIIKLIETLKRLMDMEEIPTKDILILTHRDDLLNQIIAHVIEFNTLAADRGFAVNLVNLQDYERIKREGLVPFLDTATVFYYRSDLISDVQKEKIIDFRNYDNNGNWYLILDEAHKGDKNESKRQLYYSILSRNGFLFNFSATFVDPQDIITTVYNFNLEKFIIKGYGKHLYLLQDEVNVFREKQDFNPIEKQKIVLKALILLTYLKKIFRDILLIRDDIYWEPLMLTLVNTVNLSGKQTRPDLIMFFKEIEQIAKGAVDPQLFRNTLQELVIPETSSYLYERSGPQIDHQLLKAISLQDILLYVFNSSEFSGIEVITIPNRKKEVIFKLKSTDQPFGLIKIGDAIRWIRENLPGYEVIESYEDKSIFENIENREEISLLMGSRAFYEGWDSNRPNLIMFINIGRGTQAKKFVTQSIGRGVRVEPIKNRRQRLRVLNEHKQDEGLYPLLTEVVKPLETLFILGTNRESLKEVILTLKLGEETKDRIDPMDVQLPSISRKRQIMETVNPRSDLRKLEIPELHFQVLKELFQTLDDRILVVLSDLPLNSLEKIKNYIGDHSAYFTRTREPATNIPIRALVRYVINHFQEDFN